MGRSVGVGIGDSPRLAGLALRNITVSPIPTALSVNRPNKLRMKLSRFLICLSTPFTLVLNYRYNDRPSMRLLDKCPLNLRMQLYGDSFTVITINQDLRSCMLLPQFSRRPTCPSKEGRRPAHERSEEGCAADEAAAVQLPRQLRKSCQ